MLEREGSRNTETWLSIAASIGGLAVVAVRNKAASKTERGFVGLDEEGVQTIAGQSRFPSKSADSMILFAPGAPSL